MAARKAPFEHLTYDKVRKLSAQECAIELDILDQDIVRQLQEIDANFVKSYRILTDRVLPSLEMYGQASKGILESAGFWKTFFETSAGIRLTDDVPEELNEEEAWNDQTETNQEDVYMDTTADQTTGAHSVEEETSIVHQQGDTPKPKTRQQRSASVSSSSSIGSPKRRSILKTTNSTVKKSAKQQSKKKNAPRWSTDVPLSTTLQHNIENDRNQATQQQQADNSLDDFSLNSHLRKPLVEESLNSPELELPELRTMTFKTLHHHPSSQAISYNSNQQSSKSRHASTSTPRAAKSTLPDGVHSKWNGLTDLTKTPLSSLVSPQKKSYGGKAEDKKGKGKATPARNVRWKGAEAWDMTDDTLSPPLLMSVNRTKLTKTPSKEAAKLVTRDVLLSAALRSGDKDWRKYIGNETMTTDNDINMDDSRKYVSPLRTSVQDSPALEPPSVIKNWASRGYANTKALPDPPPPPDFSSSKTDHHRVLGSSDNEEPGEEGDVSFGKSVVMEEEVEEWGDDADSSQEHSGEEDQDTLEAEEFPMEHETLFGGRQSLAAAAAARRRSSMKPTNNIRARPRKSVAERGKVPDEQGNDKNKAWLKGLGPDEMHTLHGGDILQSQPFDHSPLAGKDWRGL